MEIAHAWSIALHERQMPKAPPSQSGAAVSAGRPVDVASVLFLIVCGATLVGLLSTESALHEARLPVTARLGLLALELVAGAVGVAVLVGVAALVGSIRKRLRSTWSARALDAAFLLAAWFIAVAYGVSWALFAKLGSFLDSQSLALASVDGVMLLKHFIEMSPVLLVVLPLATLVSVVALRRGIRALFIRSSARTLARVRSVAAIVLSACVAVALWGEIGPATAATVVKDAAHGAFTTTGEVYRHAERDLSGPVSHFLIAAASRAGRVSATRLAARTTKKPIVVLPIVAEYRPLEAPAAYAARTTLPESQRLNVIVLLVESLRPDVLKSTGGRQDVMPVLDELASQSRRYRNAYAQASHSDYADPCPLSSQYPLRSRDHHYYPEHPSYPRVFIYDVLKALGYRTAIISSQNERWGGMYNYFDTGAIDRFFHAETFHSTFVEPEDTVFAKWAKEYGHSGKVDDRFTIDEAIRWIGDSKQPFFVYLNIQSSHFPYRTPDDFPKRFTPYAIDFPYTFGKFPIEKLETVKNRYKNSLSYMDAQIARLLDFLRRSGRFERTILVVTGDNGEAFYEHGSAAHAGPLFQEAVHVPLIVSAPGLEAGDDGRLAQHIDVPPTVLALLGLPPHPAFQGVDLVRAPPNPRRSAYLVAHTLTSQIALVREGKKLIADFNFGRYYLYDLLRDPGETRDLAGEDPDLVAAMAGRLHAFQKAQLDYYSDPKQQRLTYPPVLSDDDP